MDVTESHFWVIDVESNGASPAEIIELAMVEVRDLRLTGREWHWFVRPEKPITAAVTRIHGLSDDDVVDAPSIKDISGSVVRWIENTPIVGHNVRIEVDFLSRSFSNWKPSVAIDTLKLAKRLRPGLVSYGLGKLGIQFGLAQQAAYRSKGRPHSALYDATLSALIFVELLQGLDKVERQIAMRASDILDRPQGSFL